MARLFKIWFAALLASLLLLHCKNKDERKPHSIISMAPSLTEILYALELGNRIVGVTNYCNYPPDAKSKTRLGGYIDPNLEGIVSLRPDVVVLLREQQDLKKHLDALNISSLVTQNDKLVDIVASIDSLGHWFGVQQKSDSIIGDLKQRIQAVVALSKMRLQRHKKVPRVLLSIGRNMGTGGLKEAYVAGPGTFYDDLLKYAGAENAFQGSQAYPKISAEGLVRLQPDFIFDLVPDRNDKGISREKVIQQWSELADVVGSLDAVRKNRVIIFDQDYCVIPGPRQILLLEDISRVLQGWNE